ncbi:MAG: biotin/lipoyl-containing protein, partial [Prolixibacteraceae bacterium]
MSEFKVQMPKLGESVQEATITKWFVKEGDKIEEDGAMFEVATEKVDSEIPSPVDGVIAKILYKENDLVPVGEIVAIIQVEGEEGEDQEKTEAIEKTQEAKDKETDERKASESPELKVAAEKNSEPLGKEPGSGRFYSPLVLNIAREEKISFEELDRIQGSGEHGRVQKKDLLQYLEDKKQGKTAVPSKQEMLPNEIREKPKSSSSI